VYLSAADIAQLPLPAALIDRDGAVLAHTPEWQGPGISTIAYRLPVATLTVALDPADQDLANLMTELLATIRAAARGRGIDEQRRLRLEVLTAGLALVAGAAPLSGGTTEDVLARLGAVLAMVSRYPVTVVRHRPDTVPDADLLALALRQLVVNARRHDDATMVELAIDRGPTFTLEWDGATPGGGISAARHVADRGRWGLGFVRLACDALGATYLAPAALDGGSRVEAVLGLDRAPRLLLPLAKIRGGIVAQASPAWDEETHAPTGRALPARWQGLAAAATAAPGAIVNDASGCARCDGTSVWLAIPPHGSTEHARDLLLGLRHEQDLLDVPEPFATSIRGLAGVIALLLGDEPHRVAAATFSADYNAMAKAVNAPLLRTPVTAAIAPEPALVAFLAARFGGDIETDEGRITIHVPSDRQNDPLLQRVTGADDLVTLTVRTRA
jgi:hypothetical protein